MNSKEDELSELQEQIEKYQSLLEITSTSGGKAKANAEADGASLRRLHALAFGGESAFPVLAGHHPRFVRLT